MPDSYLFSPEEWRALQFAVFDVFMMVSQIDGKMDEAEQDALYNLLNQPKLIENSLVHDLLSSIAADFHKIFEAYNSQYKFDPSCFEVSFTRVGSLVDDKLDKDEAQNFKVALGLNLGGIVANASGKMTELGQISENELRACTTIAKLLGTDMSK